MAKVSNFRTLIRFTRTRFIDLDVDTDPYVDEDSDSDVNPDNHHYIV